MGHFVAGNVDLSTAGWLLLGSIPGIVIASKLAVTLPDRGLRLALGAVLLFSGIELAPQAGAVTVVVGTSLVVLLVLAGRLREARRPAADASLPLRRETSSGERARAAPRPSGDEREPREPLGGVAA
jgi:hypothetical protein